MCSGQGIGGAIGGRCKRSGKRSVSVRHGGRGILSKRSVNVRVTHFFLLDFSVWCVGVCQSCEGVV